MQVSKLPFKGELLRDRFSNMALDIQFVEPKECEGFWIRIFKQNNSKNMFSQ